MAFSLAGLAPLAGLASGYQQGMDWRQQQALRGLAIQQAQLANQQAQEQQQVLPTIYAAAQQLGSLQGLANAPAASPPPPTTGDTTVPGQPMSAPTGGASPNAIQLAQNFVQQGYPPAAAAGLAGAFTGESGPGLNPQAVGDSGAGVGIASWEGPRRAALQRLPAAQSFPTQARFAASELAPGGPEASTGQALRNFTGTPQQAAALATTGYLRPNQNAPSYAASMQQRQQAAQQVYQALGGQPTDAQAQPLAHAVGAQVPPQMQGMAQLGQLAQLIQRTAPAGTPDNVKAMALFQLHQMLAPDQKQMLALQLQVFKDQMRFETDTEIARMRSETNAQNRPGTIVQQGDKTYRIGPPGTEPEEIHFPGQGPVTHLAGGGTQAPADPKSVEYAARMISQYRMAPISGWALRSSYGQQVMAKVAELNPDYDATKYAAKQRGQVAFTTGRQADTVRSFSVAISHLAVMADAATALANGDVQSLNRLKNTIKTEFGYDGPVDFNFVKTVVGDEVTKAIIGGVGTQGDRADLQRGFQDANSPEQLAGVSRRAKQLMAGQLSGYRRQAGTAGFSDKDFEAALSPEAKAALQENPDTAGGLVSPAGQYKSADEVKAAYQAGKITREQASNILKSQFGMQ